LPTTGTPVRSNSSLNELLSQLPKLVRKSAQATFLAEHKEFLNRETVCWVSDLVRDQSKVNAASAVALAQLAMAIAAKLRDRFSVARSLRAMGNALYVSGQNKSAIMHHEKARKIFAALRNRTELARTLSASTQPLILTGKYLRALSNAKQARRMLATLGDRGRVARLDVNIGNIFHRQDRFAQALKCYRRAHRYFSADAEKDPEGISVVLHNIAMCLVSLNDFHGALAAYQEAREIAEKYALRLLVGQADYNIAALYYLRGEHYRAIRMLLSTREACRKSSDRYHVALCNLDLSEIYLELNLIVPAAEMAQEASTVFQKLGMGYEAGKSLVNLALATARQNQPRLAIGLLANARRRFIKEKNSAWPFLIDLYQAAILMEQDRQGEAQRLCIGARRFFQKAKLPSTIVQSQLLLARSYLLSGKPHLAQRQCLRALAVLDRVELPLLSCRAQQLMGQACLAAGSNGSAYGCYQKARRLLEKTRTALRNEEMKISFMEDKLEIYESLIQLCLDTEPDGSNLEEAFEYVEESKSRILQDVMSMPEADRSAHADDGIQPRVRDLRAEINWYSSRLGQEELRGQDASHETMADLQTAIRRRENELLRLVREMPVSEAVSAGLAASRPATIPEVRKSLPADSTLLEYFQIQDRLLAVILTQENFKIVPVTEIQFVAPLWEKLQFQLGKFRLGSEYVDTFSDSLLRTTQVHLRDLHDKLLAPVEKHLQGRHLVIVPHGFLHRLPFQALYDGSDYLIDKFSVSYAPSATVQAFGHSRTFNRQGPALVMGIPDAAAPQIGDEAKEVAKIVPKANLFLGKSATLDVLRKKGPNCRFIHIATHGYFRQDSPMFSGIRLADSVLSLMDLYQMKLPAELVTLSGCATGANAIAGGDELLGLIRGLIYAGARAALLTLWDVHDRSTLEFMTLFYRHLTQGANKTLALQKAACHLRERYPHPYYWAAFSLIVT
jgi:CHAT domain-containing protein/tetratricopeptide (TPR) repeat protein